MPEPEWEHRILAVDTSAPDPANFWAEVWEPGADPNESIKRQGADAVDLHAELMAEGWEPDGDGEVSPSLVIRWYKRQVARP